MVLGDLVRDGDALYVSSGAAEPARLIEELVRDVAPRRRGLSAFQVLTGSTGGVGELATHGHRVLTTAPGPLRRRVEAGEVELLDLSMRQCAAAIEEGTLAVDGVLLTVVRAGGWFYAVPATDLSVVAFERARFRAVEVLPGWEAAPSGPRFAASGVDYIVDARSGPAELELPAPSELSRRIGELVESLVPDGATIELGVGRALASVAECLAESGKSLSVHSGLISDWTQELVESGVASRPLACGGGRPVVAAIAMGSDSFNAWLGRTDAIAFAESRHAHDPGHLMSLRPFVAINSAAAVDLHGNVGLPAGQAATSAGGGLTDFATAGAYGGLSVIALPSRTSRDQPTIVGNLGAVHVPGNLVTHVVTERGIADLRAKSPRERVAALTAINAVEEVAHR